MINTNPEDTLKDREVRSYFLSILGSELTIEEKYSRFVEFFRVKAELEERLIRGEMLRASAAGTEAVGGERTASVPGPQELVARAARESGIWDPGRILAQTRDSIVRAVRRLRSSRSPDGGWGFHYQKSDCWGTAYAVLCLDEARQLPELDFDVAVEELLRGGLAWLERHPRLWSVREIPPDGGLPVYEASLAVRCFHWADEKNLPAEARENLDRLLADQNDDGGWDAKIWGRDVRAKARVYSEVGATTAALKALAAVGQRDVRPAVERAVAWLAEVQNEDGSWNEGSWRPGVTGLTLRDGSRLATINKTCDGIQGILIARRFDADVEGHRDQIDRAIAWLQDKEKPILEGGRIRGWKWEGEHEDPRLPFENTCLTLETLVQVPEAPLPMLVANADWLIRNQIRRDGDLHDGNWKQGHTARIALSLIRYYRTIAASPLFQEPAEVQPEDEP